MSNSLAISGEYFSSDLRDRFLFFLNIRILNVGYTILFDYNLVCNAPEP